MPFYDGRKTVLQKIISVVPDEEKDWMRVTLSCGCVSYGTRFSFTERKSPLKVGAEHYCARHHDQTLSASR